MIFFDLETKGMPTQDEIDLIGDEWDAIKAGLGGLSVAITLSDRGVLGVWDEHDIEELVEVLEGEEIVVTYNGKSFDIPVLSSLRGRPLALRGHLDLYEHICSFLPRREPGYCLDAVCRRTFGEGKRGNGEEVYRLVKEGRWGKLTRYCLMDVLLLKKLYAHLAREGWIITAGGRQWPTPLPSYCGTMETRNVQEKEEAPATPESGV